MKIKTLMDFLNKEGGESAAQPGGAPTSSDSGADRNIVYIENARLETVGEHATGRALIAGVTQWSEESMGEILLSLGKLTEPDIDRIIQHQRKRGLYFGEAALELGLLTRDDILVALSRQFGYSYSQDNASASTDMVMASSPFGELAEEFRSIRSKLLTTWLSVENKVLAISSTREQDGRSYVAANLALAFAQLGKSTLLIDGDLRAPRQHEIFSLSTRVGLSMLLAGRINLEELDMLPSQIPGFPHLSVLGCGAVPPNPSELLGNGRLQAILEQIRKYFDIVIIDIPPAIYRADVMSVASVAGSALLVTREGCTRISETKQLMELIRQSGAHVVGAILNRY